MTAIAQGSAGLALVIGLALLRTRQVTTATILLWVQATAVVVAALAEHRAILAVPPLAGSAAVWLAWRYAPRIDATFARVSPGLVVGIVLAVLSQAYGVFGLPLGVVLLSVLLATSHPNPGSRLIALAALQNGIALAGCLVFSPAKAPMIAAFLSLPLAASMVIPADLVWRWMPRPALMRWSGWIDLTLSVAVGAATLVTTVSGATDGFGSIFAPLLALDGIVRAIGRHKRRAMTPMHRTSAVLTQGFAILAVCIANPVIAWIAVLAAIAADRLPRRTDSSTLGFAGAGIALFGLVLVAATPSVLGYFSVFVGFSMIAAVVPDLAVVLAIVILRMATQKVWPFAIDALGVGLAVLALAACAALLCQPRPGQRLPLLVLAQASIAVIAICLGQPDGRFAALVLLILLILTRTAARIPQTTARTVAVAGMSGMPPLTLFPGTALIVLAISNTAPWLLLPVGIAAIPMGYASIPSRFPSLPAKPLLPTIGWLPLALALLAGYFAPSGLAQWWHLLTAGRA